MKKQMKKQMKKATKVDRAFMLDLANRIYDPKTRKFLRLCTGNLQNGPDPKDPKRTMHCALGELYFAMTGEHPRNSKGYGVSEEEVKDLAVELVNFESPGDIKNRLFESIRVQNLPASVESDLEGWIDDHDDDAFTDPRENDFYQALNVLPELNDRQHSAYCTHNEYKSRACRVARQLREAAKFLPE